MSLVSSMYSALLPSSGTTTYTVIVSTKVSLGKVPENHTCVMFWALLWENWVAESLLDDVADDDEG